MILSWVNDDVCVPSTTGTETENVICVPNTTETETELCNPVSFPNTTETETELCSHVSFPNATGFYSCPNGTENANDRCPSTCDPFSFHCVFCDDEAFSFITD